MENREYDEICSILIEKDRHDLVEKLLSTVGKNNALTVRDRELNEQLQCGRDYLMSVDAGKITVEDALESFGFGRNGLFFGA